MRADDEIRRYAIEVYGSEEAMPAANKEALRKMIANEDRFWEREAVREDSHSPVGDWNNAEQIIQEQ